MSEESHRNKYIIENNEEVVLTTRKIYRVEGMPHYRRIGIMSDKEGTDVLDLLGQVSKSAFNMYIHLKRLRNEENNITTLPPTENHSDTVAQNRSLRELEKVGLIKKVKRNQLRNEELLEVTVPKRTYIINPIHIFPRTNEGFSLARHYWNQL